jgi:two-component system sensor histidine kinase/response regulator
MTALAMKGDRERCLGAGMDGYLTKPIRPQELDEMLEQYVAMDREELPAVEPVPEAEVAEDTVCAQELLDRVDGDRSFIAELLELLQQDYPMRIGAGREALAHADAMGLQHAAHALKGALTNLAATKASGIAAELEAMGKSGDLTQAANKMTELETEMTAVLEALEGLCMETVQ